MTIKMIMAVVLLSLSFMTKSAVANWLSPWKFTDVQWFDAHQQEHNGVVLRYANFEAKRPIIALASQFSQATPKVFQRLLTLPQQVILSGIGEAGEHWLAVIHAGEQGASGYLSSMHPLTQEHATPGVQNPIPWWQPQGLTPVLTQALSSASREGYQQLFALPDCDVRTQQDVRKQLETRGWQLSSKAVLSDPVQVWQRQGHQVTLISLKLAQGCGLYVVQRQEELP